jgi:cyanate permease
MLKCKQIAERATDYLEEQQTWPQRRAWKLHLFMCVNCRRFVKQLNLTCDMCIDKKSPEASDKEVDAVMTKIKQ